MDIKTIKLAKLTLEVPLLLMPDHAVLVHAAVLAVQDVHQATMPGQTTSLSAKAARRTAGALEVLALQQSPNPAVTAVSRPCHSSAGLFACYQHAASLQQAVTRVLMQAVSLK